MSGLACQATGLKLGYVWNEPVPMTCFPTIPSLRVKGLPLLRRARRHNCSAMGITAYTFRQSLIIVLAFANKELEREILTLLTFSAPHTWPVTVWTRHDWQFQIVTEIVGCRFPIQVTGVGRGLRWCSTSTLVDLYWCHQIHKIHTNTGHRHYVTFHYMVLSIVNTKTGTLEQKVQQQKVLTLFSLTSFPKLVFS